MCTCSIRRGRAYRGPSPPIRGRCSGCLREIPVTSRPVRVRRVRVGPPAAHRTLEELRAPQGPRNSDRLVDTTYIQRIATTGGLAPPAAECTAATAETVAEISYTADYYFWEHTGA